MKASAAADSASAVLGPGDIDPNDLYLSKIGQILHDSMKLQELDQYDRERLYTLGFLESARNAIRRHVTLDAGTF